MSRPVAKIVLSTFLAVATAWGQEPTPKEGQFQVNTYTTGDQLNPEVSMDGLGDFVVAWNSSRALGDSSSRSVHARRYSAAADLIFADGFETGDTTAWTTSVP